LFVGLDPGTEVRTHLGRRVGEDPELEEPDETEFGSVIKTGLVVPFVLKE